MKTEIIHIKGMLTSSCKHLVNLVLKEQVKEIKCLKLGRAEIFYDAASTSLKSIDEALRVYGFCITKSHDELLIDKIKQTVIDLIYHMNNTSSIVQKSDYLVEMLNMSYDKISREFRKHEALTLEKYIIKVKVERIKGLIDEENYTLSEIAYMMDYSSVQHLSSQFKNVSDITVSDYKKKKTAERIPLDRL